MSDDEELILKGSALYCYLQDNGFSNFESYESNQSDTKWFQPCKDKAKETSKVTPSAPQWTLDHINCIRKCGLILEDHLFFIEFFSPEVEKKNVYKSRTLMYTAPVFCIFASVWRVVKTVPSKEILLGVAGLGSLCVLLCTRKVLSSYKTSHSLKYLSLTLSSLEKLFVQFKKMLFLVHQNDLFPQNPLLRPQEILELKRKLKFSLCSANTKFNEFLDAIKNVPLSVDVDPALQLLCEKDISFEFDKDGECSFDSLKKLFNCYILVQSEFLRRLALGFCPEFWSGLTPDAVLNYCHKHLPTIQSWSSDVLQSLIQDQKIFRAIVESKDKQRCLKRFVTAGWDFSDVYVSLTSASTHIQSILLQTQNLQDILENHNSAKDSSDQNLLQIIAQILTQISKEMHAGQVCYDTSLFQIYKLLNIPQPSDKQSNNVSESSVEIDPVHCSNSDFSAIIQDEVFELTVPLEDFPTASDDDDWTDLSADNISQKKNDGETSKIVLQELKTVLVKKADEWREREKRAMELKGMIYTAPVQLLSPVEVQNVTEDIDFSSEDCFNFMSPSSQSNWPLPRLKTGIRTHRQRLAAETQKAGDRNINFESHLNYNEVKEGLPSRVGFGASLLAEAMAKSKMMQVARMEDVFHDSDDDSLKGD